MAALTKTQLDHAKTRLAAAKAKFIDQRMALLGVEPEMPEYTDREKEDMIRAGTATLLHSATWSGRYHSNPFGFFVYPDSPIMIAQRAAKTAWNARHNAVLAEADVIENGLLDELVMAPDGVAALKRIAEAFAD